MIPLPIPFLHEPTSSNVLLLILLWMAAFAVLLMQQFASKNAVGLTLAYALGLSMIHVLGPIAYSFDHYQPRSAYLLQCGNSLATTHAGMWMSTLGFFFFVIGCLLGYSLFKRPRSLPPIPTHPQVTVRLPGTLILLSLLFFLLIAPITRSIPSVGALGSGGANFGVIGLLILCYQAYYAGQTIRFKRLVASSAAFPIITVLTGGFMSYGVSAAIAVVMPVVRFFRPRWISFAIFVGIVSVGTTVFVNWMQYRDHIRDSVWYQQSMGERIGRVAEMVQNLKVFDPWNQEHMEALDKRMNQSDFVGKAMRYTGYVEPFSNGETLWAGVVAWVPRVLWPGKPIFGGSGNLVTSYTGQDLSQTTSFGVGQVLELYINYGTISVVIGMFVLGLLVSFLDFRAAIHLHRGDLWNFARWMLPAIGLLQPNGAIGEIVSACAANGVLVFLMHQYYFRQFYDQNRFASGRGQQWISTPEPDPQVVTPQPPFRGSKVPRKGMPH